MICDDAAQDDGGADPDFQRWFFGGSPPECDHWPRHAFEDALHGATAGLGTWTAPRSPDRGATQPESRPEFALA